uniref:Uncharacterized protein n=1 Tax=Glossina pallidipes TaxID=7398 RepID=A0A1A9ZYX4_GLOPL
MQQHTNDRTERINMRDTGLTSLFIKSSMRIYHHHHDHHHHHASIMNTRQKTNEEGKYVIYTKEGCREIFTKKISVVSQLMPDCKGYWIKVEATVAYNRDVSLSILKKNYFTENGQIR